MHIPDGFINISTAATTYAVSAGSVAYSIRRANKRLGERHVPLMGVMAAFVFAAQMLNFPIIGGTSGHLIGAALAAILLGPWAGTLVMACVLLVQSLVFQDGGIIALGANILNMGVIASFAGYYVYKGVILVMGEQRRSSMIAGFAGAWVAVMAASVAASVELAVSGTTPFHVVLPAMVGVHALIGIGEGLITTAVLGFVLATRSDLLQLQKV